MLTRRQLLHRALQTTSASAFWPMLGEDATPATDADAVRAGDSASLQGSVCPTGAALVLSGGGARGDFQVGAVAYLYDRGVSPKLICATSVGSINAVKLAEGEGDPTRGLRGLAQTWLDLSTSDDMFRFEQWFTSSSPSARRLLLSLASETAESARPFLDNPVGFLLSPVIECADFCAGAQELRRKFSAADPPKSIWNLSPIAAKLFDNTYLDMNRVRQSGIRLRLAVVSLESGELRHVTEQGVVLNASWHDHFYTTSRQERDRALLDFGYRDEGIACYVHPTRTGGSVELHRLFHPITGDHFYTTSAAERDNATGYRYEGIACFVHSGPSPSTVPLYRLYHPLNFDHFYTTSAAERDNAIRRVGFNDEGIACHVFPGPGPGRVPLYRLLATGARQQVDVRRAVLASAAIPGFFPPIKLLDENYVDGGVRDILPIGAAVEAGATPIFAILASPPLHKADESFDREGMGAIATRSVLDIMTDETVHNEIEPPRGWGVPVTLVQPTYDVHDIMTIDPGLIRISMAYGFMRAADALDGHNDPTGRSKDLADAITRLRKRVWEGEASAEGHRGPRRGRMQPSKDPGALRGVRSMKWQLKALLDERRSLGGALPNDSDRWIREWEAHTWSPTMSTPWESWNASVRRSQEIEAEAPPLGADGTLLREPNRDAIFVVYGGAKFYLVSPAIFEAMGFSYDAVKIVPDGALVYDATLPRDGTLLRNRDDAPVYVTYGGAKFHIPDPATFDRLGFAWNDVRSCPDGSLGSIASVPVDGTLLKEEHNDAIFVVFGGAKFYLIGPDMFDRLGFAWGNVRVVPDGGLAQIPTVPRDGTLVKEIDAPQVYVIRAGRKTWVPDCDTFINLGMAWSRVRVVPTGALANL
jgi:predicted acylesterase/phospholipase RssA